MSELISNGEVLRTIRAKINLTLTPFTSRAHFEATSIPSFVTMLHASDGGLFYRLLKNPSGTWVSADGARWQATPDGGLSPEALQAAVELAAETITINGGTF